MMRPQRGVPARVEIAVVGAGFSGIGMAIRLRQMGFEDFIVVERGPDVGGTWRDNTYPGAACDVPSNLYSFSFAPNPTWTRSYSSQPEIWSYLRDVVDRFGVAGHFRFDQEVLEARFDEFSERWELTTPTATISARTVVWATGSLSEPKMPPLAGLDEFTGEVFHSAAWNHAVDLEAKQVAVIGTGASAIQFIPQIQPLVAKLTVYQRSAPWVIPRNDKAQGPLWHRIFARLGFLQKLVRLRSYLRLEFMVGGVVLGKSERRRRLIAGYAKSHLSSQVTDGELRQRLTPDYEIGCKRLLVSDDYYPALTQANVELVAAPVSAITADGVVDEGGRSRQADVLIVATGFEAAEPPFARRVRGPGGTLLADAWRDGSEAYLGSTVPGFPNFFMLVGPNTTLGHNSMIYMIESQLNHVGAAVAFLGRPGIGTVQVRPDVAARYNRMIQDKMKITAWVRGGCTSWYLDHRGVNTTLWPAHTAEFRRRTRHFHPGDFTVRPPGAWKGSATGVRADAADR